VIPLAEKRPLLKPMPSPERLACVAVDVAAAVALISLAGVNPAEKKLLLAMRAVDEDGFPSSLRPRMCELRN